MDLPDLIPLQQSPRYVAALRLMGREVLEWPRDDAPPLFAIRRRVWGLPVLYLPRVTLGDGLPDIPRDTTRIIIPETGDAAPGWPILTPQHIAEVNVPRAPVHDRIWANMHGKWRNRLRRALDGPVEVVEEFYHPARHAKLLEHELRQRRSRGYSSYPPGFLAAFTQANPHHSCLLRAQIGGDTVAFMLFLLHGPVATYAVGWTSDKGRKHHAHNRLMFAAMTGLFSKGICRIDLGSIDTDGGAALARFKLGCGARARTLGPTRLVPPGFRVSP